ncbi:hypothetical protein BV898_16636 [Hypsibius exemplaris]|uniref:Uncharacterized protein n=1 Tax=Hypsibius exemplaris TaxID=2072580 RepID=A0A9X6RLU1_HYPEX|nr:hypothetical protein BV898_16636 [Hypsibius exemplaris]
MLSLSTCIRALNLGAGVRGEVSHCIWSVGRPRTRGAVYCLVEQCAHSPLMAPSIDWAEQCAHSPLVAPSIDWTEQCAHSPLMAPSTGWTEQCAHSPLIDPLPTTQLRERLPTSLTPKFNPHGPTRNPTRSAKPDKPEPKFFILPEPIPNPTRNPKKIIYRKTSY